MARMKKGAAQLSLPPVSGAFVVAGQYVVKEYRDGDRHGLIVFGKTSGTLWLHAVTKSGQVWAKYHTRPVPDWEVEVARAIIASHTDTSIELIRFIKGGPALAA